MNHALIEEKDVQLLWSHNLYQLTTDQRSYILPKPYLLMIHNKLSDLISVLLYTIVSQDVTLPTAYVTTVKFIEELMILHYQYDNDFYKIMKTLNPLCNAESIA